MSKRLTSFNDDWSELDEFKSWLERGINTKTARRSICKHSFDISNPEKSAIVSHSKGKKHMEKMTNRNAISTMFFKNSTELNKDVGAKPSTEIACSSNHRSCKTTTNTTSLVIKSAVAKAEILWCLKTVLSHPSFRSCENISSLFSAMFSDSDIAKSFSIRKTKGAYYINFGIAPYFKDLLLDLLSNKRFIIKRPSSTNLLQKLIEPLSSFSHSNVLQLSMDGPNVNLDVLKQYHQYRVEKEHPMIVNIGSCGLHILHGALQYGFKQSIWDIDKILRAMWQIFHQSPAIQDIYIYIYIKMCI